MGGTIRGWVGRTTAPLARQVRPPGTDRRVAGFALVAVAGGAAAAKSVLIATGHWSLGGQIGLVAAVATTAGAVLAAGADPGERTRSTLRSLGLVPLGPGPSPGGLTGAVLCVVAPLVVSVAVTGVGLALRSEPGHLDGAGLVELVVLVAGAEELIHRGAVLALAHRALPAGAAEVVGAAAFGLSHLGNDGGWGRVAVPLLGGLAFSWLRHRSGSLAGPVAGHIATNLPGRVLAG